MTPSKNFDNGSDDGQLEQPDIFANTPKDRKSRPQEQDSIPQFNYVQSTNRNQIRQAPDISETRHEPMIFDYQTVKDSQFETFEQKPKPMPFNRKAGGNTASYGIIKQQMDQNEEFPPHSSSKKPYNKNSRNRGHFIEDSTNRQLQMGNQLVIQESPEYTDHGHGHGMQDEDPYQTVGVQESRFQDQQKISNIRQTVVVDDDPYKTYHVDNQSGLQSEYMTMNMDDGVVNTDQKMKNSKFFDKLNKFDKRKNAENPSLANSRAIRMERSANKRDRNYKYL